MNPRLGDEADVGLGFEQHDDVRTAELEVGQFFALADGDADLGGDDLRRDLAHADRQHRDQADRGVQHDQAAGLGELVAGRVGGVAGAQGLQRVDAVLVAGHRLGHDLQLDLAQDDARLSTAPPAGAC
nr:hypothetical protein [Caulobacter sp. FWC2]